MSAVSPLGCSKRGKLLAGWCHCQPGFWGEDCARSTAWQPDPDDALEVQDLAYSRTELRVYK